MMFDVFIRQLVSRTNREGFSQSEGSLLNLSKTNSASVVPHQTSLEEPSLSVPYGSPL